MEKIKKFFLGDRTPAKSGALYTQLALTARVLVGGYVLYLANSLKDGVKNADSTAKMILFICIIVIFAVVGGLVAFAALRDLIIGRYAGGKLDLDRDKDDE